MDVSCIGLTQAVFSKHNASTRHKLPMHVPCKLLLSVAGTIRQAPRPISRELYSTHHFSRHHFQDLGVHLFLGDLLHAPYDQASQPRCGGQPVFGRGCALHANAVSSHSNVATYTSSKLGPAYLPQELVPVQTLQQYLDCLNQQPPL